MAKLKANYPKVTFRPTTASVKEFNRWFKAYKKQYSFVTKDLILCDIFYRVSKGITAFPWEKK